MFEYKAQTEDILFTLEHAAGGAGTAGWDRDLAHQIVAHFAQFAERVIAPLDEPGDAEGCRLQDGRVRMPAGFRAAYRQLAEDGWQGLTAPEEYGGQDAGTLINAAVSEIFTGANHSLQMIASLAPGAIHTIAASGTDAQKAVWLPRLASGAWLSTMCLTEPQAGSDLSRIRCRADQQGDGWVLSGEKIFISGGDQDLTDAILHLVLARTGTIEDGIRGLSLFLCPSAVDGARNAVTVGRLEKKMGLNASPTCHLIFDGARAELLGPLNRGLAAMFVMMNHARLDVALQGVAHAARATDLARCYAAQREQGRDPSGQTVTIDQHPDVARRIDDMDAMTLGARCMALMAMVEIAKGENPDLIEFLTPICKSFCSDIGVGCADAALQVLGGYGYLREYRAEQNLRDARICPIYEGTNAIHAITLTTRLLRLNEGAARRAFSGFIAEIARGSPSLTELHRVWLGASDHVQVQADPRALAHDYFQLTAAVLYQAAWVRLREAAGQSADPARIRRLAMRVEGQAASSAGAWHDLLRNAST